MSERGKYHKKKLFQRDQSFGRGIFNNKSDSYGGSKYEKDSKDISADTKIKQPTILLKTREPHDEAGASPKRNKKDSEPSVTLIPSVPKDPEPAPKIMTKSEKLLEDGVLCNESIQEYLQENNDFLVVGVIGTHGVGKSTIMNFLSQKSVTEEFKKSIFKNNINLSECEEFSDHSFAEDDNEIFKVQSESDLENNVNATHGVDIFITSNRVILLDCQPFNSVAVLEDLIKHENKRTSLVSEFIPIENSGEIQGLQLAAFLMSVCHVLIVVQDWFFDCNVVRFLQSAEMLKPTISNPEDELTEHFPNLLLIHNKAQLEDFSPSKFKSMQKIYRELFSKTKLHIDTHMGLGTGRIINYLNPESCGAPINLFLIPDIDPYTKLVYNGHPSIEELFKKLKSNILGSTRNALTHVQLTEKTWLVYCTKVWDTVKKSPFFVEYTKLMP
ncbi:nonsense-mediated mRNA decay factor SMG9 isoform X2 [Aethina tumida]|uniref:nonsense-mediated mRNA decay factor SMG9 isoform X2 n=1 Tax=Aethina tumida TaxID=116153 RepID=UPI00096B5B1C|nr:nonsense-mediated mRNA decay factor SMG9 isoform X2 [Aethina tumida]